MKTFFLFLIFAVFFTAPSRFFAQNELFSTCSNCLSNVNGQISHSAFGDYDNDGDMDLLVGGLGNSDLNTHSQTTFTYLYRNDGGEFRQTTNNTFTGLMNGAIAWGDYDRDGLLDFAIMGLYKKIPSSGTIQQQAHLQVYRNRGGGLFASAISLGTTINGGLDWGDYDLDGDLDLIVSGSGSENGFAQTILYQNTGTGFNQISANIPGYCLGNVKWGDYDKDGDLDVLICGQATGYGSVSTSNAAGRIYRNNGSNSFEYVASALPNATNAYGEWCDFDNDGYLDIAIQGEVSSGSSTLQIFHNRQDGTFEALPLNLRGNSAGNLACIDIDGDGKSDLISTGINQTNVYVQSGLNQFTLQQTLEGHHLLSTGFAGSDSKPDIVLDKIYTNQSAQNAETAPLPQGLRALPSGSDVLLVWTPSYSSASAPHGLNYNVRVGTAPGGIDIVSPMSLTQSGARTAMGDGNAGGRNTFSLKSLPAGTYYWAVQAQNPANLASEFSAENTFTLPANQSLIQIEHIGPDTICPGSTTTLAAVVYPAARSYQWYLNNQLIANAHERTLVASQTGTYTVTAVNVNGTFNAPGVSVYRSTDIAPPQVVGDSACAGQQLTLSATPGSGGGICKWYDMNNQYLGIGDTFSPFVPLTSTTAFKVYTYSLASGCNSQQFSSVYATVSAPAAPTTQDQSSCSAQAFQLSATPGAGGSSCRWYVQAAGGTSLAQGTSWNTGIVETTTTWYVSTYDPETPCESVTRTPVTAFINTITQMPATQNAVLCVPGAATLSAAPGANATTCRWYNGTDDATPFYTGLSYTLANVPATQTYYVSSYHPEHQCEGALRSPATVTVGPNIGLPTSWNQRRYGSSTVTLEAIPGNGATTCKWYSGVSKDSYLASGTTYTTAVLNTSTTYFVSSYDEAHGCEGAGMRVVQAQILPVPQIRIHPDQVYPIPNLYGSESYKNVNLFTGDVNLSVDLLQVVGPFLNYDLNAFYNSRSAGLTPSFTQNPLGGLGWKLMDYPKVVADATTNTYYLLDGIQSYPLTQLSESNNVVQFAAPGEYHLWSIRMRSNHQVPANSSWTLTSEDGTQYAFQQQASSTLDNNLPGNRWDLSVIREAQGRDSIMFTYEYGNLQKIQAADLQTWTFLYDESTRIRSIEKSIKMVRSNTEYPLERINLSYGTPDASSFYALSSMEYEKNVAPPPYTAPQYQVAAPSFEFSYNQTNYPGALATCKIPQGGFIEYEYSSFPGFGNQHQVVSGINTFSGNVYQVNSTQRAQYSPVSLQYTGAQASADSIYLHFNKSEVLPGGTRIYEEIGGKHSSFESSSGDPVFSSLVAANISPAYALSGTKSYRIPGRSDNTLQSNKFALDPKMLHFSGANTQPGTPLSVLGDLDSVRLVFYVFNTNSSQNITYQWNVNFYDSQNRYISSGSSGGSSGINADQYGKWAPAEILHAIPVNARFFDFTLVLPRSNHSDFYIDDFSTNGAQNTLNGKMVYHFFNGKNITDLHHLPGDYFYPFHDRQVKTWYKTGFEAGETYADWLNMDHSDECKPKAMQNEASRQVANNGSAALRLRACGSHFAKIYPKNDLLISPGTDAVLLAFTYSSPQFSGMQFKVECKMGNTTVWDTMITSTGSYYTNPSYRQFYKWINVTNPSDLFRFTIVAEDAGSLLDLNEFYIDDLRIVFIDKDLAPLLHTPQVNAAQYLGVPYHTAVFTQENQEMESSEVFWIDGQDATAANTPLILAYRERDIQQGAAELYEASTYRADGRLESNRTVHNRTLEDGSNQLVWYLKTYIYADSLYPALNRSGLHMLDELAAEVTTYSIDQGAHWSFYQAGLAAWTALTPATTPGLHPLGSIWTNSASYIPNGSLSLSALNTAIRQLPTQAPPALNWTRTEQVLDLSANTLAKQTRSADSLIAWQQYSALQFEDNYHQTWNRTAMPIARFSDASPQNSFYYGFEKYETPPVTIDSSSVLNSYYFTGQQCNRGSFQCTMPFNQGETPGNSLLIAFQYMMNSNSTLRLSVWGNNNTSLGSSTFTANGEKWQSAQKTVVIPAGTTRLRIKIEATGNGTLYTDDLRVLPAVSSFSATAYNMDDYSVRSVLDNNGADLRFLYNWKGTQYASIGPGKVPQTYETSYFSRMSAGNQADFDPLKPNYSFTINARDGGHYFAFNDLADQMNFRITDPTDGVFSPNGLSFNRENSATIPAYWNPLDYNNFGVSYQLTPTVGHAQSLQAGFMVGQYQFTSQITNYSDDQEVLLFLTIGDSIVQIGQRRYDATLASPVHQVMMVFQENHVHIWFDDEYIPNTINYRSTPGAALSLISQPISGNTSVLFKDLSVFNSPEVRGVFSDGLNHTMQEQELNGNDLIVQETQYDLLYRPVLQTKEVNLPNQWPGFKADFVSSFNWTSGEMAGSVQQAKNYVMGDDSDQHFMYWRSIWHGSPQQQLKQLYQPGHDFALRQKSDVEKAERWAYTHEKEFLETIKYTTDLVQIIIDPESAPVVIAMDVAGLLREHFSKTTDNKQNEQALTSKFYDAFQQQTLIKLPWANTKHNTKPDHVLRYTYDQNRNLITRSAPESGLSSYSYDRLGRLRFSQTSTQADSGVVAYYKYDRWSRPIEAGVIARRWDQSALNSLAHNPAYPNSGTRRLKTYSYDGPAGANYNLSPNRGQISQIGAYRQDTATTVLDYNYDLVGNLTQITQTMPGADDGVAYHTRYQYDMAGNIKLIQYPDWQGYRFQVRYSYDYRGNLLYIGDSTALDRYASYTWNPDGSLFQEKMTLENSRTLPAWHWYNAPGWLNFSGFGDTAAISGSPNEWWGNCWPHKNYSFSFFENDLDYNLLTDWWSSLWGQKYYNGNLSSTYYRPASGNPSKHFQQGYNYNEYGNLRNYYNTYQYFHFYDENSVSSFMRDSLFYDLNNNLVELTFVANDAATANQEHHANLSYRYNISDSHNRPRYMAYQENSNELMRFHFRYDTLYMNYTNSGYMNLLYRVHRNATATSGQAGSIDYQTWKNPNINLFGQLDHIKYRHVQSGLIDSIYTSFRYDGKGMRSLKQVRKYRNGTLQRTANTRYIRNNNGDPMMEVLSGGSRDTVKYYVWGPTGMTVMYMNDNHSTRSWFVLKDNLRSAKQLINRSTLSVDEDYTTDEYGLILPEYTHYRSLFNYIFTGQEYDSETQLHYFRARMYDPYSKLFMSPDPAGTNPATPYAFASNDPVNRTDPTGKVDFGLLGIVTDEEIAAAKLEFENVTTTTLIGNIPVHNPVNGLGEDLRTSMIEFQNRFDHPDEYHPEILNEFIDISQTDNNSIARILRPGNNHEMLPVSTWRHCQRLGLTVDDIQRFSMPTTETFFQVLDPITTTGPGALNKHWLDVAIPHGGSMDEFAFEVYRANYSDVFGYDHASIGSSKAHNELRQVIATESLRPGANRNTLGNAVRIWMRGEMPNQLTRVHANSINQWMALWAIPF